jgi:hypothetical protein
MGACFCTGQCKITGYCPVAGFDHRYNHKPGCDCEKVMPPCRLNKAQKAIDLIDGWLKNPSEKDVKDDTEKYIKLMRILNEEV